MSKEDVKRLLITPAIESKWDAHTQIRMEKYFTEGRVVVRGDAAERAKGKKADDIQDMGDFDLICYMAFDKEPVTKAERANKGLVREVLSALFDKYAESGVQIFSSTEVLQIDPFCAIGEMKIDKVFGGEEGFLEAVSCREKFIKK